ncbi:(d)CMP kinase [Nocardia sp. N2S4-5]|uniref:(d)CMP kinase n=1 Tax=Nocardia sp. N2S4-5 TaxID=3351565 RepID=UPI0037D4F690
MRYYTSCVGIQPRRGRTCLVVAVDGGVATGKSSVCLAVSRMLGVPYFNAGLLYRALALWCIRSGISLDHGDSATQALLQSCPMHVSLAGGTTAVSIAGGDLSNLLKSTEVSEVVPVVARNPGIRATMTERQRAIVRQAESVFGGVVIDGRDATSVVVPDADVKILLTADPSTRATRVGDVEGAAARAEARDREDARVSDFLRPRPDVSVLDTSGLDRAEVISEVLRLVFERRPDWADKLTTQSVE